jgi:hypothetical protein
MLLLDTTANCSPFGFLARVPSKFLLHALTLSTMTNYFSDEILEQFKNAAAVGNDVTAAMAESLAQSISFVSSLRVLQAQVVREQEEELNRSREVQGQFLLQLRNSIFGMIKSFQQRTDNAVESVSKLKRVSHRIRCQCTLADDLKDVDDSHSTALNTQEVLLQMQHGTLDHARKLDAAQVELWQSVSSSADVIEITLQNISTDLPGLVKSLESMMEHVRISTKNLSSMHVELEEQLIRNNEQLLLQQNFISHLRLSSFAELCQYAGLLVFILVANSVHPWLVSLVAVLTCKSWPPNSTSIAMLMLDSPLHAHRSAFKIAVHQPDASSQTVLALVPSIPRNNR